MTDLERIELALRRAIARLAGNGPVQYALQIIADELAEAKWNNSASAKKK